MTVILVLFACVDVSVVWCDVVWCGLILMFYSSIGGGGLLVSIAVTGSCYTALTLLQPATQPAQYGAESVSYSEHTGVQWSGVAWWWCGTEHHRITPVTNTNISQLCFSLSSAITREERRERRDYSLEL